MAARHAAGSAGTRQAAVDAYKAALADIPSGDPDGIADKARAGLRTTPDPAAGRPIAPVSSAGAPSNGARWTSRCRAGRAAPAPREDQVIRCARTCPAGARRRDFGAADLRRDHRGRPASLTHRARAAAYAWSAEGVRSTWRSAGRARATAPRRTCSLPTRGCSASAGARSIASARSSQSASHLQIDTRWTDTSQYGARMDARVGAGTNIIDARSLRSGVKS